MRAVLVALTEAVHALVRRSRVRATIEDRVWHFARREVLVAAGESWQDVCVAGDGSLIRVRVTRGSVCVFQQELQWQRITNVENVAQWQVWHTFSGSAGAIWQDGMCAVSYQSGVLRAFAQRGSSGRAIWCWQSNDQGISWSTNPTVVVTPPSSALVRGIASAGNNNCFLLYEVVGGFKIGSTFWNGSTWSSLQTWTFAAVPGATGITTYWLPAIGRYTVCYTDGQRIGVYQTNSSGALWEELTEIATGTTTAIRRVAPQLTFFAGRYHLTCVEEDTGTLTGVVYTYPRVWQSIDLLHWSGMLIFPEVTGEAGARLLRSVFPTESRARYALTSKDSVMWEWEFTQTDETKYKDVGANVISYRRSERVGAPAQLHMVLDNSAAQLMSSVAVYGAKPEYQPIGLASSMILHEGYYTGTPSSEEAVACGTFRIEKVRLERSPGRQVIIVEGIDVSAQLDEVNRYQITSYNKTLEWLIKDVCARAGLYTLILPAGLSSVISTFIVQAGQAYRLALNELCQIAQLVYFLDQNEVLQFRRLASEDSSIWSYASEIESLVLEERQQQENHVLVVGRPPVGGDVGALTMGEAYASQDIRTIGRERLRITSDYKLTTTVECTNKANFVMQREQRQRSEYRITVPVNPVLQLLDVVTVSDQPEPGGSGRDVIARIVGIDVEYDAARGTFREQLLLEGM